MSLQANFLKESFSFFFFLFLFLLSVEEDNEDIVLIVTKILDIDYRRKKLEKERYTCIYTRCCIYGFFILCAVV